MKVAGGIPSATAIGMRGAAILRFVSLIIGLLLVVAAYLSNDLALFVVSVLVVAVGSRVSYAKPHAKSTASKEKSATRERYRGDKTPLALGSLAVVISATAGLIAHFDSLNPIANYLWLLGLVLIASAALRHDRMEWRPWKVARRAAEHRSEIALVVVVILIALALRAYDLRSFPPVMHGDEGEMGVIALGILSGKTPPLFEASPFFSLPYLFNYLQAGSIALFGSGETGLRMLSALFGTACIPLLYLTGRAGWGRVGGAMAAWLMAVSHLAIHYSRLGFIFIESVFGMLLMTWLLARAHTKERDSGEIGLYVGIGLTMGLSQYFYYASRVMPIIAAPLLLYLWREGKTSIKQLGAIIIATVVAFAPLGVYFLSHLDVFLDRVGFVSITRPENVQHTLGPNASLPADAIPLLQFQLTHLLQMFVRGGDAGGFYFQNIPAFDPLTSVLFWLGLGLVLSRLRRYHEFAVLMWFGLGLTFGGVLTIDAPSAQRLMVMIPAIYLLGGVCVARVAEVIGTGVPGWKTRLAASGLYVVAALLLAVNVQGYFGDYVRATQGREPNLLAHLMLAETQPAEFYLLGMPVLYSNHGAIKYLAYGLPLIDLHSADEFAPPATGEATLIFATPNHRDDLAGIEAKYTDGSEVEYRDPIGRTILFTYRIPR